MPSKKEENSSELNRKKINPKEGEKEGDATWTNRRLSLMVLVVGITTHLCSIAPETGQ